ncbi:glutamyl-tRNA reductase [Herbiconiux sp. KACC 21604]|uniref:glutamyl-tRNA reductase n=1 Tax=unclassified Herbiconiux TaxID=2618217 RepID=UPI00149307A8|nr:glutamyl-tRNA reductase [Herbiconiux sp. SALV-R1]QJU55512.1 glutamyl-tRNA reductase [Herbiconiux sp. SALV-R1]WPO86697.1 glutamyl-tRNA reductase [Herbiconiux sp. KACC 21604]
MLICLTANHRNASFDMLEKLSVGTAEVAKSLVSESDFVQGAVVLATCNRFEAYLDIDEPLTAGISLAVEEAAETFGAASGTDVAELRDSLTVLCGDGVADHLFAVSSGLESVVVGEDEIAGQVKRALSTARIEGTTSSDLERLFQRASHTSRGVKTKTGLGGAGRSLARLALDLAESRVTDWAATRVLLVGTGQYARVTLANLRERGVTDISVYSPSGRAVVFAAKQDLVPVPAEGYLEAIAASDIVITCSTAETVVLDAAHLAAATELPGALARRLVIDLGLPRNVDPGVAGVGGTELLDLETISLHAPLDELNAESDARALVDQAAAEYRAGKAEAAVTPAVVALRSHLFDLLDAEIERSRSHGASSASSPAEQTERALRHLVGVILHSPSVRARELAREGRANEVFAAVETLFGLGGAAAERSASAAAAAAAAGSPDAPVTLDDYRRAGA